MTDIETLRAKLEFHEEQVRKLQTAIEVLESLDENFAENQAFTNKKTENVVVGTIPSIYNKTWTQVRKTLFVINEIGRCAIPSEIEERYNEHQKENQQSPIKDSLINQVLTAMKKRGLIKSYRTETKSHAWGLAQWFDGELPRKEYEAVIKVSLWN